MAQAYVDASVMGEWKTSMDSINVNCLEAIEGIENCLNNLNDSFRGDFASEYSESYSNFLKTVKSSHENLKNVESFLDTVVDVMNNQ
jgi:uncharacterized protein YukE